MNHTLDEKTVVLRCCANCGSPSPDTYRFCRWCGTNQKGFSPVAATCRDLEKDATLESVTSYDSALAGYVSVSALLMNSVMQGARAVRTGRPDSRIANKTIGVLIFVPLWIMMIMVSPFEAYFVSKSMVRNA
jgi:hypothetical protein